MKFKTISEAKKQTGLSYLGSVAPSSKIAKGLKYNEATYIIYLAPAETSGYNVCPMSTEECRKACLAESGHNRIDVHNRINKARIKKTKLLFEEREFFMEWLIAEIESARKTAEKKGMRFSVRLNGTSDISPVQFNFEGKNILEIFPDIQFYDYSKVARRFELTEKYDNYDLTFSYSGKNAVESFAILGENKGRVAMVFDCKTLPETYMGFQVVDGDKYDMRYLDPKSVIVGLRFKKVRNKIDTQNSKFIIKINENENDQKKVLHSTRVTRNASLGV